jgi:hypothetical protein
MIYGGTKYLTELGRVKTVLRLVVELNRKGRVTIYPKGRIDALAKQLKREVNQRAFNDEHLVAIVIVSECRVVCTDDKKAMPYLKCTKLYAAHGVKHPKIYNRRSHKDLCCDENLI